MNCCVSRLWCGFHYVYGILYIRRLVCIWNILVYVLILVRHIRHKDFDALHNVNMFFCGRRGCHYHILDIFFEVHIVSMFFCDFVLSLRIQNILVG